MEPLVGVIVPCFNQGRFAAEGVDSLRAQTYTKWKAVVIDDASTDDSIEHLRPLAGEQVDVVHLERNLGRACVRNEAVRRLGPVDFILSIDCDDRLTPDYLRRLVVALDAAPRAGLAYGTLRYFGAPHATSEATWPNTPFVPERRYLENIVPGPGTLFRAAALAETDGWRGDFAKDGGEDWDLWIQVLEAGWDLLRVPDAIYDYRQHPASFLASHYEAKQVRMKVNMLRHHAHAIRRSCGTRAFLEPQVIPAFLVDARHGRFGLALPLLRHAPVATLALVARHYARRVRSR